ncbi:MAG TPA: hypothetical protein VFZ09_51350 [Archangium sp.]|uniref:hypothetical protein n=1 Tax=Archangium sp. TaxID=1872627 RepID=UPI002E319026|nr:hypothetical protein [Archangium sp.]HEX5754685.1 hypothetical protein [Archangium sp.]
MSDTNGGGRKSSTDEVRLELVDLRERLAATSDAGRPDAVIDPAETRSWIPRGPRSVPRPVREGRRRFIDTW